TPVANILAGHVVMSIGFALLFTPLFTTTLSSVRPELYSHGSATLSSIQQVAGAAGVALLVALMTSRSTQLLLQGVAPVDALTGGIRAAFRTAAVLSLVAVACVFFVQRPRAVGTGAGSPTTPPASDSSDTRAQPNAYRCAVSPRLACVESCRSTPIPARNCAALTGPAWMVAGSSASTTTCAGARHRRSPSGR